MIGGNSPFESVVRSNPEENRGLSAADWDQLTSRILYLCKLDHYLRYEARDWTQEVIRVVARDLSCQNIRTYDEAYRYAVAVLKRVRYEARRQKIRGEKVVSIDQETEESSRVKQVTEQITNGETPQTLYERKQDEISFRRMKLALGECAGLAARLLSDKDLHLLADYHAQEFYDGDWTEYLAQKNGISPGALYTRICRALERITKATVECMKSKDYGLPKQEVKDYLTSYINEVQKGRID